MTVVSLASVSIPLIGFAVIFLESVRRVQSVETLSKIKMKNETAKTQRDIHFEVKSCEKEEMQLHCLSLHILCPNWQQYNHCKLKHLIITDKR